MLRTILQGNGRVTPEQDKWLRMKLLKLNRYKNLVKYIEWFHVGYYNQHKTIFAMKTGKKGIPLPKNQLSSNKTVKTRLLGRLRKVVEEQVRPLRKPGFHVDHIYPFANIVEDWLELEGLSASKVRTRHYKSFSDYHKKVARYQYLTPEENIRKGRKYDTR